MGINIGRGQEILHNNSIQEGTLPVIRGRGYFLFDFFDLIDFPLIIAIFLLIIATICLIYLFLLFH